MRRPVVALAMKDDLLPRLFDAAQRRALAELAIVDTAVVLD